MDFKTITILIAAAMLTMVNDTKAQTTIQFGPDGFVKIEEGSGGFFADLDAGDRFSRDHDVAGDINGDGILDLVVGARSDDDGQTDAGAVYILFMNNDGTVQSNQKISMLEGGFTDPLNANNFFGYGVAGIGDYDNDGIPDIAVSAPASTNRALYIIHLNSDGTVKSFVKNSNIIAQGLSAIGDLNNDGRIDLVACDPGSDMGGTNRGAINILFLDSASQVVTDSTVTISSTSGGFGEGLENGDAFGGREVAMLGDLDNDGTEEMAVGAFLSDGGKGAVWILSLDSATYNVVSKLKITEGLNGFSDTLTTGENPNGSFGAQFGHAMCAAGDLNGDGVPDLITGANQQNEGYGYILYMNSDKTVKTYTRVNESEGGFDFDFGDEERFSRSLSFVGDLRGDGTIAVNFGGGVGLGGTGSLYLLFFKPCGFVQEPNFNHWTGGNTLFTNWDHDTQMLTNDSLTFEQCTFKAFETDAPHMTYNFNDGRCICKDSTAVLAASSELSTAFLNECYSGFEGVLPVELSSFTGEKEECNVSLDWTTASEDNFSHYELEWSEDGRDFSKIASIEGSKNSSTNQTYHFKDTTSSIKNYYRLKILDMDGSFEFSDVIFVQTDCYDHDFIVYPNPANKKNGYINVHFKTQKKNLQIEMIDLLGRIVKSIEVAPDSSIATTAQISLEDLEPGSYYLRMEGFDQVKMIVVQQ